MADTDFQLSDLRRPRLLVRAARHGLQDYRRERDLKRLIEEHPGLSPETAMERLLEEEDRIEATRKSGEASYSIARHIQLLVALMAEARLMPG